MDIKKVKRKEYYEKNKERIKEVNRQYYHDNKIERQEYNRNYWSINGQKYIEARKNTLDHKKIYMKNIEYHTEYTKKIAVKKSGEYIEKRYGITTQNNNNKSLIVYFGFKR